ncbi:SulP family inorganic anion transporter [Phreatobacter stygius]|uniref:SulP family inorganic anion transporter n=1 Tax=Phreatobacter stygius TaxID=1940610 RepID=UPI001FE66278|nr:SulP family inorganic anion transporter [Phreatobacter stygius]
MPGYAAFGRDVLTGLTLAAITIPEQMATARLGGFEPQIGFYAFVGATIGFALAGASRILTVGADSTITPIFAGALAALAASGTTTLASAAVTLALIVGALLIIGGTLRLGWIADLLSEPVVTGFLAGISVHIVVSQLPGLFGLAVGPGDMFGKLSAIATQLAAINPFSTGIGLGVLAIMLVSERISGRIPGALIALVLATLAVVAFDLQRRGVAVLGTLPGGLPHPVMPDLGLEDLRQLLPLALTVALVIMMQTAAVSHSFPDPGGRPPDIDRDFVGAGAANLVAGALGAMPVNASPPRTAVVAETGGVSQAGPLVAAALVLALVLFGGQLLAHVPEAALAGVLLFVAQRIFRLGTMVTIARQAPAEFALIALTAAAIIVLPIQAGVAIGIGLSLLHGVWMTTQTRPVEYRRIPGTTVWWPPDPHAPGELQPGVMVIGFQAPLLFANARTFQNGAAGLVSASGRPLALVVLEAGGIANVDYTAAMALRALIATCKASGADFAIARLESVRARQALDRFGILADLGPDKLFRSVQEAVATLTDATPAPR